MLPFWLVPIFPLLVAVALLLGVGRIRRGIAPALAIAALVVSLLLAAGALVASSGATGSADSIVTVPWLTVGGRAWALALARDPLSALAATLVAGVALIVFVYAATYMAADRERDRFFGLLCLFAGAMLVLVLAADLITLFIAWEVVGLCSYLLIGFWRERPGVPAAATKAFLTTRIGDAIMLLGIVGLTRAAGTGNIAAILAGVQRGQPAPAVLVPAAALLLAGALGKSAQVPFQGWLPDAMRGPTPVSALLHSATMVAAGVFLIARLYPLFLAAGPILPLVAWIGVITALLGGAAALVQPDLKRTLAYSTISQLGFMFLALGAGSLLAAMFLLVAQALYKALLFLAAGAVDHTVGGTDFARMGGLARTMPGTFAAALVGAVALAGLPVTLAWPPKDAVLAAAWSAGGPLFAAALLASVLTGLYAARLVSLVFLGVARAAGGAHGDAPLGLRGPVLALAILVPLGLLGNAGWLGSPLSRLLAAPTLAAFVPTVLGLITAVVGLGLGLLAGRAWPGSVIWPPLVQIAPLLAGEFGLVRLYQVLPMLVLAVSRAVAAFDDTVFNPLGPQVAGAARRVARGAGRVEGAVFDAAATALAQTTLVAVRLGARFDTRRVDAGFTGLGSALLGVGSRVRRLQTGRIENYLLLLCAWGLGVVVVAVVIGLFVPLR